MSICTAPIYKLKELKNLFIEMTEKNCNQRCKNCYINFSSNKPVKDFISVDIIKQALADSMTEPIEYIYLTGAEPMTHPDFNTILRLCLKRCSVCICTNGSLLNEKKVRFLKKVEDEISSVVNEREIIFKLSLVHFNETENDALKYRGNFRQTLFALKTLSNYNFSSILSIQNCYDLDKNEIKNNFEELFRKNEISYTEIQINSSYPDFQEDNFVKPSENTDCMYGRVLTNKGIYACPFLSGDYRGRSGSSLKDFSENYSAETEFCATCSKNQNKIFGIE